MKVVFPYFAQLHQVLHSLPIAAAMAQRHPDVEVHAASAWPAQLDFIRRMLAEHAPGAPVQVDALRRRWLLGATSKRRTMLKNLGYLSGFDAIVVPERTSLFLRSVGLGNTQLVWTRHGAGDRAIGFASDIAQFDFVLLAGAKIEQRLLAAGLIRPGHYASGVYAKFDWLGRKQAPRLFDNDRPTVLYNPHFRPDLSSWEKHGREVLDFFAASERYNLIFAPHVRLFDPPDARKYRALERYAGLPHLRIDLGSVSSIDMSYLEAADLYLGDVSSQVSEFVVRPRPCLFLDAHGVAWRDNPDYRFWTLGPVIDRVDGLAAALESAFAHHRDHLAAQRDYVAETFGAPEGESSSARGADAIVDYLARRAPSLRAAEPLPSAAASGL
jgi:hypothetical protein